MRRAAADDIYPGSIWPHRVTRHEGVDSAGAFPADLHGAHPTSLPIDARSVVRLQALAGNAAVAAVFSGCPRNGSYDHQMGGSSRRDGPASSLLTRSTTSSGGTHVVDGPVGQRHHVEAVDHESGVAEVGGDAGGVAPEGVDGDRMHSVEPLGAAGPQPVVHRLGSSTPAPAHGARRRHASHSSRHTRL
jgi:hypothetical protein